MSNLSNLRSYLHSQLCVTPPEPTKSFSGQTIIVTGSNTGMGLEAARYFVRLGAAKVILAVRSLSRGPGRGAIHPRLRLRARGRGGRRIAGAAPSRCGSSTSRATRRAEAFARRARETLPRLDVVVANAGVFLFRFERADDGDEKTVAVNVVGRMLLALLLLPKLRETAVVTGKPGVFTFTGSFTHWMAEFPERKSENILAELNDEERARMEGGQRYYVSKLIQLLTVREFAEQLTASTKRGRVITSIVNPGFVRTEIMRHGGRLNQIYLKVLRPMPLRAPKRLTGST